MWALAEAFNDNLLGAGFVVLNAIDVERNLVGSLTLAGSCSRLQVDDNLGHMQVDVHSCEGLAELVDLLHFELGLVLDEVRHLDLVGFLLEQIHFQEVVGGVGLGRADVEHGRDVDKFEIGCIYLKLLGLNKMLLLILKALVVHSLDSVKSVNI